MTGAVCTHRRVVLGALAAAALAAMTSSLGAQRAAATAPPKRAALAAVRSVTRSALPRGERITIELSAEVRYASDRVANPDRVYFDFRGASVATGVITAAQALSAGPLVSTIRLGRNTLETARVVLELKNYPRYSAFPMYNPFRLVVDVEGDAAPAPAPIDAAAPAAPQTTARTEPPTPPPPAVPAQVDEAAVLAPVALKTAPSPPPVASLVSPLPASALTRGGDYSLARQLGLGISRVVIDAGHGGHDPGAQSNGLNEAELVLDVALRLEQLLKDQQGVDVVLTRRTDEFIPLEERTAIANREGADLFLSIHANASRRTAARGIETYFLNFATSPEAEAVAARENATSSKTMGNLPDLVKTITLNNKVVESRELATLVQASLVRRLRQQNKTLRDLGVKQAAFVVLIGAQMPSVLAEISFVTNRAEASLLKQTAYRQRIAQSLADAVLKYQASLKKPGAIAANTVSNR